MIKEKYNLSEKIQWELSISKGTIAVEDVKRFIKQDEDLIHLLLNKMITKAEFWERRDKLAGEKLK